MVTAKLLTMEDLLCCKQGCSQRNVVCKPQSGKRRRLALSLVTRIILYAFTLCIPFGQKQSELSRSSGTRLRTVRSCAEPLNLHHNDAFCDGQFKVSTWSVPSKPRPAPYPATVNRWPTSQDTPRINESGLTVFSPASSGAPVSSETFCAPPLFSRALV